MAGFVQCIDTMGFFFPFAMLREALFSLKFVTEPLSLSSWGNEFLCMRKHLQTMRFLKATETLSYHPKGMAASGDHESFHWSSFSFGFTSVGEVKGQSILHVHHSSADIKCKPKRLTCYSPHKRPTAGFACMWALLWSQERRKGLKDQEASKQPSPVPCPGVKLWP